MRTVIQAYYWYLNSCTLRKRKDYLLAWPHTLNTLSKLFRCYSIAAGCPRHMLWVQLTSSTKARRNCNYMANCIWRSNYGRVYMCGGWAWLVLLWSRFSRLESQIEKAIGQSVYCILWACLAQSVRILFMAKGREQNKWNEFINWPNWRNLAWSSFCFQLKQSSKICNFNNFAVVAASRPKFKSAWKSIEA